MLSARNAPPADAKVEDFSRVFERGTRWKGRCFHLVYFAPGALPAEVRAASGEEGDRPPASESSLRPPACRWAVIASKKGVDKRATRRNRTKRRLRVLVRTVLLPALRAQGLASRAAPLEVVLIAGRRMLEESWPSLVREVEGAADAIVRNKGEPPRKNPC